jgi:diadenylate cyclase
MVELFKLGIVSFTIIDILDIIIVAIGFVWVYRALKDTIALQIFFGLFIIIALSFITDILKLRSLNWILQSIQDIWLLAFVILFQPELRRLLLKITQTPLFKLFIRSKISQTIDEVIDAVVQLSEKHIGAILVFIRSQNVEMTVDTGIPMQALVSKELLLSVFNTRSPLHDGAVIIRNELIVAARCVLPLSSVTKFESRNLGTRHRAGLGLSEQVDVLVLIVSEETGSISLAEGGYLTLDIPREKLTEILSHRLSVAKKGK